MQAAFKFENYALFETGEVDIMIITHNNLVGLNLGNIQHIIVFDFIKDQREFIRFLGKFDKTDNKLNMKENSDKIFSLIFTRKDKEEHKDMLNYLTMLGNKK
jgi:hypothetical protein